MYWAMAGDLMFLFGKAKQFKNRSLKPLIELI